jgi:hypothetical protein
MTGFAVLLRKELRQLWPYFGLILALFSLTLLDDFVLSYPDQPDHSSGGETTRGVFEFIFAYFVVHSAMSREEERHSIEFLGGLPLNRTLLFVAKVLAAFCLLVVDTVIDQSSGAAFSSLSDNSLTVVFPWTHWAKQGFVEIAQSVAFLGLAFFFASFRRFAIPLACVAIGAFALLGEAAPKLEAFNVLTMTEARYDGLTLELAWPRLGFAAALGLLLLGVAGRLYVLDPDTLPAALDRLRARTTGLVVVIVLLVGAFIIAIASFDADRTTKPAASAWGKVDSLTEHYSFVYPATQRQAAGPLIAAAEGVYGTVATFFDGQGPAQIAVDLSGSRTGTLGTAHWTSVNIDLASHPTLGLQLATLGHETTHVFISYFSDRRLDDHMSEAQFFHEGFARYVQIHAFGTQREVDENVFVSAVLHARKQASFATLIDADKLQLLDEDSVYPLGAELISALIKVYGPKAPVTLLKALAAHPEFNDQHGDKFWRLAFQAAGFSLDAVVGKYASTLEQEKRKQQARIEALPALASRISQVEGNYLVTLDTPLPEAYELVCRFKSKPGIRPDYGKVKDNTSCTALDRYDARTMTYQVGMKSKADEWTIFEPWLSVK